MALDAGTNPVTALDAGTDLGTALDAGTDPGAVSDTASGTASDAGTDPGAVSDTDPGIKPKISDKNKQIAQIVGIADKFLENKIGQDLENSKTIVKQVTRFAALLSLIKVEIDHLHLEIHRSIFFPKTTSHQRWTDNDQADTAMVPKICNQIRGNVTNVLLPVED